MSTPISSELPHLPGQKRSTARQDDHYIVGVGASAGGLEAINELFDNISQTENFSFVVVQHLSPTHKSLMDELLTKHTQMKVVKAEEGVHIRPNQVYLIPAGKNMTVRHGKLRLTDKADSSGPNMAIDIFLKSLAQDKKDRAIAIILSGTGTDGTRGIEAIKQQGGLVLVQDPATAKFDGMPNSAISSGCADMILPAELMGEEIFRYPENLHNKRFKNLAFKEEDGAYLQEIVKLVREHTSHDFSSYKEQTLYRRIMRRMIQLDIDSPQEFIHYLQNNPDEINYLGKEFLIGVTRFFRDPDAFAILEEQVIPDIIKKKSHDNPIKLWVTACSTGEEAYSLAMLLCEGLQKAGKDINVKIFATDIDPVALEYAAKGSYPESIANEVPAGRLEKFFTREGNRYCVSQQLRRMVIFAQHNVTKDPPFSKMDLVSCRNMLIYMKPTLQRKVLATLHFASMVGGYLFLGSSENCDELEPALKVVSKKWNIYRIIHKSKNFIFDGSVHDKERLYAQKVADVRPRPRTVEAELQEAFHSLVTEELGYAVVFINEEYDMIQATGDYKRFLEMPERQLQMNLLRLVPKEVSLALNLALRKATRNNEKAMANRIEVVREGMVQVISLVVKPFLDADQYNRKFISVLFKEEAYEKVEPGQRPRYEQQVNLDRLLELESELRHTKQDLQAMVEEMETANEELQSSNEELISSNEELQSTNEELQSVNEELHTVNAEHQQKIRELEELNDDLNNYFRSSDIGQIFLDRKLLIRKFTPSVKQQINLIESDLGRPISHLSYNIKAENLVADIEEVLKTGESLQKEVETRNGQVYLMKILPYLRQDRHVDGAVVTFVDITKAKELSTLLQGVLDSSANGIMAFSLLGDKQNKPLDLVWTLINKAGRQLFKREHKGLEGLRLSQELPGLKKDGIFKKLLAAAQNGSPLHLEYHYQHEEQDRYLELTAVPIDSGLALTVVDISEKKRAEEDLLEAYDEVKEAEEKLLKLNAELEKRVNERTLELSESEERFRLLARATNDAVWDWKLVSREFWWNEGFVEIFGYKQNEIEPGVESWFSRLHPQERDAIVQEINEAINKGQKQWSAEHQFRKADGSYTWVYNRGYILENEYGIPYRMLGSMVDLSTLKKAQDELQESNKNLRKINTDLDNFVYTASHDLRAPVANLEGLMMLLGPKMQQNLDEKDKRLMDMVEASIEKLKRTIHGLLEITKVQKDLEKQIEPLQFEEVLEDVRCDIRKQIEESGALIETHFEVPGIRYTRVNLQSIFYNLLSNALKYSSPDRQPHIRISTEQKEKHVVLTFTDNGLGMSEAQQKKLFTMFKRFHTHVDGTGIGLYMVKRIIENNEGRIEVKSTEGKGTAFKIYFRQKSAAKQEKQPLLVK
ncbi:chemotaxis protein CheB [Cesiribacter andamanensis]|uniref:Phytochrome-like protein cph1 n=1 Tax=Cesiribacter andamanensis AMV16 TaxID=1279009 RepID=M7NUA8_9BACT|nr:chemotaxis protein CheB [Cesiribacter andamanensis]EMR02074.1 Phytochrome-like protein cph1 [Cesiribacter andamanensis AMV16]